MSISHDTTLTLTCFFVQVLKYIQDFPEEIVIGPQIPSWLWQGERSHTSQHLRVRHDPPLEVECENPSNWRNKVKAMREDLEQQLTKARDAPLSAKIILSFNNSGSPGPDDAQDGHMSRMLSALHLDMGNQSSTRPSN